MQSFLTKKVTHVGKRPAHGRFIRKKKEKVDMADSGETNDFENQIDRVVTDRLTATLNPHINDDDLISNSSSIQKDPITLHGGATKLASPHSYLSNS